MRQRIAEFIRVWHTNVELSRLHPRVNVELAASVPAWSLKVAVGVVAFGCILLSLPGSLLWLIGGILVALIVLSRWAAAPAILIVVTGFSVIEREPFEAPVFGLILGLHLVSVLVGIAGDLPLSGRVERSLLFEALPRFLGIQVVVQSLALGGRLAVDREVSVEWLALAAGLALAATAWVGAVAIARHTTRLR